MSTEEQLSQEEITYNILLNIRNTLNVMVEQQCKEDFLTFVRRVAPTLITDWHMGRHIEVLSDKLQKLVEGKIKRLMVFLPPRSSKSVICSKLFLLDLIVLLLTFNDSNYNMLLDQKQTVKFLHRFLLVYSEVLVQIFLKILVLCTVLGKFLHV